MKAYNRTAMDIWRALLMYRRHRHHRNHRRGLQDDRQTNKEIEKKPINNMTIVNDNKDDDNDLYLTKKNGSKID